MGGIFGVVALGSPAATGLGFEDLSAAMARWGRRACRHLTLQGAHFGRAGALDTGDTPDDLGPARCGAGAGLFTAEGRLDNRDELCVSLEIPPTERLALSDDAVMRAAYDRWGEACAEHLLGDWAFAAWHPLERRLVLGRDQLGNASLYYARVGERLAFASHGRALLSLPWVPRRLNETRLARLLVVNLRPEPEDGSCTMYRDVQLLLPAHTLCVTPHGEQRRRYWRPEPLVRDDGGSDTAYAEALLECLRTAVRCRLRGGGQVGAMLSAGLDSTSIAVLAAQELAWRNERLTAFTSVPAVADTWPTAPGNFPDEGPLAALVAGSVPNMDHVLVDAREVSPIAGLKAMLRIVGEPTMGGGNYYWLVDVLSQAAQRGVRTVLRGSLGNHAMSWRGPEDTWLGELRRKRFGRAVRVAVHPLVPARAKRLARWYRLRKFWTPWDLGTSPWRSYSAIRSSFAEDVGLRAGPADPSSPPSAFAVRAAWLDRAAWRAGVWSKDLGAAFGLSLPDPAGDIRVIALAFSIPDRLWRGPLSRWFFRQATKGILPDPVRLETRRGLQAADIVSRLRQHRAELDDTFTEIEASPLARHYIDLPYCRQIAAAIDGPPDPFVSFAVHSVLMRALGAGLFLAAFERRGLVE
jgi:asparagine synthase (glutamine-hydrolysing)